jgi:hypothetical protein
MNSDDGNPRDWVEPLTKRGRWGRRSSRDKTLVELDAVRDVSPAFLAEFGVNLTAIRPGNDPPDVLANVDGHDINVEVCELLKTDVRVKRAKELPIAHEEQLWTEDEFQRKLRELVAKKVLRYSARQGLDIDILLVVSCELWLMPEQAQEWVSALRMEHPKCIRAAYFAQERLPDYPKPHWPLVRLF